MVLLPQLQIERLMRYFPARLILAGLLSSYIIFQFEPLIDTFQASSISTLLYISGIPATPAPGGLLIGTSRPLVPIDIPTLTRGIFYVFFFSLAISINAPIYVRIKALIFTLLTSFAFILSDFAIIISLVLLRMLSGEAFIRISLLLNFIVGGFVIELFLYTTLVLPKRTNVRSVISRSYFRENVLLISSLIISIVIIYLVILVLQVSTDSTGNVLAGISALTVLAPYSLLTYILGDISIPRWSQENVQQKWPSVSFLTTAYNEEELIERCIGSMDRAAANYPGPVDIVVVNDGSKDGTSLAIHRAIGRLRFSTGVAIDQENIGKGGALSNGLQHTMGEIVFRIDGDSIIDEKAISLMARHFRDPLVGSVAGLLMGLEERFIWQKFLMTMMGSYIYSRIAQETLDTIMVQPGAFSVFRKACVVSLGGWGQQINGEDRDMTFRIARLGYRHAFEEKAVVWSEIPKNLSELREQRVRWNTGFYHSHARNLDMIGKGLGPRTTFTLPLEILAHSSGLLGFLSWTYLLVSWMMGLPVAIPGLGALGSFPVNLVTVELPFQAISFGIYFWFLIKYRKYHLLKYIPLLKIYQSVLLFFTVEATHNSLPKSREQKIVH